MIDPALPRFLLLRLANLVGAAAALLGVVILSHGQPALARLPDALGDALVVAGAAGFFAVPVVLARRWKRRP